MIVRSKLRGQLRRPKNASQRRALAHRDWLRRQQEYMPAIESEPVNLVQPSFAEPQQNQTTTVNNGSWSGSQPMSFEYQWQLDGVDIVGETSNSILYLLSMVGKVLTCIVKAVNEFGSSTATAKVKNSQFTWRNQFAWG